MTDRCTKNQTGRPKTGKESRRKYHSIQETQVPLSRLSSKIMPRSDEAAAFFHAVYSAVQEIPPGKVTTYGRIAELVGFRESGQHRLPDTVAQPVRFFSTYAQID